MTFIQLTQNTIKITGKMSNVVYRGLQFAQLAFFEFCFKTAQQTIKAFEKANAFQCPN